MRILYATAEVAPFSKVGGLADVSAGLPKALNALGHDVRIFAPAHFQSAARVAAMTEIGFLGQVEPVAYRESDKAYLVENHAYFGRSQVYGFPDDLLRYQFFCHAVLDGMAAMAWWPDILHCNDWHTAWLPLGLKNYAWSDPRYQGVASVITIHNIGYRGPDRLNDVLGPGIFYADAVTTVSPAYAAEIMTPEYGGGLDELLRLRADRLHGITNGIDTDVFDPASDPVLSKNYSAAEPGPKAVNKRALQERLGLQPDSAIPLVGMVSRLDRQKGFDLLLAVLDRIVGDLGLQLAILGSGNEEEEAGLRAAAGRHPGAVVAEFGYRADLAPLIYAGADLFLMPSRFEPCGLGQLIAMRYGTVPIVRRTGGLGDTVHDASPDLETGTGFVFDAYEPSALVAVLRRAVSGYRENAPSRSGAWGRLVRRTMAQDLSWEGPARRYAEIYENVLRRHRDA